MTKKIFFTSDIHFSHEIKNDENDECDQCEGTGAHRDISNGFPEYDNTQACFYCHGKGYLLESENYNNHDDEGPIDNGGTL